jgi:hypothetical protein
MCTVMLSVCTPCRWGVVIHCPASSRARRRVWLGILNLKWMCLPDSHLLHFPFRARSPGRLGLLMSWKQSVALCVITRPSCRHLPADLIELWRINETARLSANMQFSSTDGVTDRATTSWRFSLLWDVMPCSRIQLHRLFRRLCCIIAWITLSLWKWRWHVPSKRLLTFNALRVVISKKIKLTEFHLSLCYIEHQGVAASLVL